MNCLQLRLTIAICNYSLKPNPMMAAMGDVLPNGHDISVVD